MAARPPEQIIRDWLAENGPTRVRLDAFEQTWGIDNMGARDRRRVAAALAQVGVQVDPPLARVSRREKMLLSLVTEPAEPETEVEPEPVELEPEREEWVDAEEWVDEEEWPEAEIEAPSEPAAEPRPPRGLFARRREATPPPPPAEAAPEDDWPEPWPEPEVEAAVKAPSEPETEPRPRRGLFARRREATPPPPPAEPGPKDDWPEPEPLPEPEPAPDREPAGEREPLLNRVLTNTSPSVWVLAVGLALMVLGSLGPWSKAILVVDYGTDRYGWLVTVAAVAVGVILTVHLRRGRDSWLPLVAAGLAAFAAAAVAADFRELVDDTFVSPDWGLYMAFLGCVTCIVVSMALLVRRD